MQMPVHLPSQPLLAVPIEDSEIPVPKAKNEHASTTYGNEIDLR